MQLNTIPRTAVKATLLGLRLPICGVEALTGQTGNASWPPAIAFEGFEAGVKQVVGSFLATTSSSTKVVSSRRR